MPLKYFSILIFYLSKVKVKTGELRPSLQSYDLWYKDKACKIYNTVWTKKKVLGRRKGSTSYWFFFAPSSCLLRRSRVKLIFNLSSRPHWALLHLQHFLTASVEKAQWRHPRLTVTITKMILKIDSDVLLKNEKYLRNQKNILVSISDVFHYKSTLSN